MFEKYVEILSSARFWQVVVAFVLVYLGGEGVVDMNIASTVASILGVSVTIGTVDKIGAKVTK
jgi:small basic protein